MDNVGRNGSSTTANTQLHSDSLALSVRTRRGQIKKGRPAWSPKAIAAGFCMVRSGSALVSGFSSREQHVRPLALFDLRKNDSLCLLKTHGGKVNGRTRRLTRNGI